MKLVVDLPKSLVAQIRDAIDDGGYEDAREFVETAIENQLQLEQERESESIATLDEAIHDLDEYSEQLDDDQDEESESSPTERLRLRPNYDDVTPIRPPSESRVSSGPLWGQYNRLLPVKFVVRHLANQLSEHNIQTDEGGTVSLPEFEATVATEAREFGLELQAADDRHSRKRGEKLSAGFPTGEDAEKSLDRFQSHFVGTADTGGNLSGAPEVLKFVNIFDEDGLRMGITEAGLEFAVLENPLLDESVDASEALSTSEKTLYLEHVENALPAEYNTMVHVADAIQDGENRPTSLTEQVAELNDDWSEAQASTNRSGIISRMFELGFVTRRRVGQRGIAYELTDDGLEFLDEAHAQATEGT